MSLSNLLQVNLRRLILMLAMFSVIVTLMNVFLASYKVQKQLLLENTLEANRVYTAKLAASIEDFFHASQKQLNYSARQIHSLTLNPGRLLDEVDRLEQQNSTFNAVVIIDPTNRVISASPSARKLTGQQIHSAEVSQIQTLRIPAISPPFLSPMGNLIVALSQPLFSPEGEYLGFISGSIHLDKTNMLTRLLEQHHYRDGSYLYVVDQEKRLLYHIEKDRIGEIVANNPVINQVITGESGAQQLENSKGIRVLAGYSPIPATGWGVVAQKPEAETFSALEERMLAVFHYSLPYVLATFALIWLLALLISRPLRQLANSARQMNSREARPTINRIRTWYYESAQLKRSLLEGLGLMHDKISRLHMDSQTDPMTGLYNRRGMNQILQKIQPESQHIAIIALDIDHFKQVNDTWGHDTGDEVIRIVAEIMKSCSRSDDFICRSGGEEFIILLPDTDQPIAIRLAERIRHSLEQQHIRQIESSVTVSCGVAHWFATENRSVTQAMKAADQALYQAKQQGRNRVIQACQEEEACPA